MIPIFMAQLQKEKRAPFLVLLFLGVSIVATLLFTSNVNTKITHLVFSDSGMHHETEQEWLTMLNKSDVLAFQLVSEQRARNEVREGRSELAVRLLDEEDFRILTTGSSLNTEVVDQHIKRVLEERNALRQAAFQTDHPEQLYEQVDAYLEQPPITLSTLGEDGKPLVKNEMSVQLLFGFTLFLVMFSIGFKLNAMMEDKINGVWNRVILSPTSKLQMYLGHMLYSFMIGFAQVLCALLLFKYVFQYELGDRFGLQLFIVALYCFVIVSICMLLAGFSKTPEQFMGLLPTIIPFMPLVSGIYFPPGMITNKVLLTIGQFFPISHAVDALKQTVLYDRGVTELYWPLAKMMLIGVVCMGIGVNMLERRKG